jgi:hypothetical protein
MPKLSHWIGQYVIAVVTLFLLLLVIDLLRGEAVARAWPSALAWAAVASAIFIGSRYRNMRRGIERGVCDVLDKK